MCSVSSFCCCCCCCCWNLSPPSIKYRYLHALRHTLERRLHHHYTTSRLERTTRHEYREVAWSYWAWNAMTAGGKKKWKVNKRKRIMLICFSSSWCSYFLSDQVSLFCYINCLCLLFLRLLFHAIFFPLLFLIFWNLHPTFCTCCCVQERVSMLWRIPFIIAYIFGSTWTPGSFSCTCSSHGTMQNAKPANPS